MAFNGFYLQCKRYLADKTASILPLTAIMLPLILGAAGLGVDVGMWTLQNRNLQTAADAAAIAAAWEIAHNNNQNAQAAALKEAMANGFTNADGSTITVNIDQDGGGTSVNVELSEQSRKYLSSIIFQGDIATTARASAGIFTAGNHCFLSLDDHASGAITVNGNVSIDSESCGMAINSDHNNALNVTGNVSIDIGDVNIAGDYRLTGNSHFNYSSLRTGAGRISDPYADLEVPPINHCDENDFSVTGNGNRTLYPGIYCGGISISGNTDVYLENGVYIIDGDDFNIGGNGTIYGENVTIIMTSTTGNDWGTVNLTGNKDVYLKAPGEGEDWAGIAFYIDRNAPMGDNKMTGNGSVELDGVFYAPSQHVRFGGNKSLANPQSRCTHLIAQTMRFHGNPYMQNDCDGMGTRQIGNNRVRLRG